jgi:hypothetical protein
LPDSTKYRRADLGVLLMFSIGHNERTGFAIPITWAENASQIYLKCDKPGPIRLHITVHAPVVFSIPDSYPPQPQL